jgi:hypothetical protein
MYLDDGLGIEEDDELWKAVVNQVKCDLINSGIQINSWQILIVEH